MKFFCFVAIAVQIAVVFSNPAFFAYDSDWRQYNTGDTVQFTDTEINKNNLFSVDSNSARLTESGVYFSALNAAARQDGNINFAISTFHGDKLTIQPLGANAVVTSSRISMLELPPGASSVTASVESFQPSNTYTDSISKSVSWVLFKYNTQNVFFAGYTGNVGNNMIFNDVHILRGVGYGDKSLRIAKSGLYFFSITLGTNNETQHEAEIYVNNAALPESIGKIVRNNDEQGVSFNTITRTWIVQVREKDEISVRSIRGNHVDKFHTSFLMFRLDASGSRPAFNAVRKAGWHGFTPLDPIGFDTIVASMGNYWNARENHYEIQTSGLYFLSVTGGKFGRCKMEIEILVNNGIKAELLNHNTAGGDENTNTLNILLELKDGDVLKFASPSQSCFDDAYYLTSFSIFFVSS